MIARAKCPAKRNGLRTVRTGMGERRRRVVARWQFAALALVAAIAAPPPAAAQQRVLDSFETLAGWTAAPSDGVRLTIAPDSGVVGRSMRLDFDFQGGGGYAIARKELPITLPANYEFTFRIRGDARPNNLEFKLVDPTGDNVWWVNRRDFEFPERWSTVTIKKRHIEFAWGPVGGGEMKQVAALEIAITAGQGGNGTVWIDELALTPLDPVLAYNRTPVARASSSRPDGQASRALDGRPSTRWMSAQDGRQWLALDFLQPRELGGLTIDWDDARFATRYIVQTSRDGSRWDSAYTVEGGNGGRDYIFLPETEARHIRLMLERSNSGRGYGVAELNIKPLEWSTTRNDFFSAVAGDAPRGHYPRYFTGEQSYWTVVGVDGDAHEAMINTDGMIETGKAAFSIEPFLFIRPPGAAAGTGTGSVRRGLITWNDVATSQSLRDGLPIPEVRWQSRPLRLEITAFAEGMPGNSALHARYRVTNASAGRVQATLYLALRPLQVNPSWQFLNTTGGVARVRDISWADGVVTVNGAPALYAVTPATGFGTATFDQGGIAEWITRGTIPPRHEVTDHFGHASGVLAYALDLDPGETRTIHVAAPLHPGARHPSGPYVPPGDSSAADAALQRTIAEWREKLGRVSIELPAAAEPIAATLASTVAWILINRDGAAIQPGSRSYERSWIRDGALTSAALLRMGHADAVRDFIEWYAPFQYHSGKVPCCVDARGADPVPEHDSHGQLIFLIAEHHRFTRDTTFLRHMWPHVAGAVAYIDSLRAQRMTPEYRADSLLAYYGLVPQSISHEGYSAKPMHSYWDDAFVLRGLKDAAEMAAVLGKADTADIFGDKRDEFRQHLMDSYRRAMATHGIDYLPGAVELGDFDATSTTVAIAPGGELPNLPQPALDRTFAKYLENFRARRDGTLDWDAYTPYELRVVGTFVRLGQKAVAHEVLDYFMKDRRPLGWNHWAEVVWRDPKAPKFIGDMPHTWVGSDFIRSVTDMLAYEREADQALVVGAGIPAAWVVEPPGVAVRDLRTHYGPLSFTMRRTGERTVRVEIAAGLRLPPGGLVVHSPLDQPVRTVTVDGRRATLVGQSVVVRRLPAAIVLEY